MLEIAEREAIATSAGCLHSTFHGRSSVVPQRKRGAAVSVRLWRVRGCVLVRVGSCGAGNGLGFGGLPPL